MWPLFLLLYFTKSAILSTLNCRGEIFMKFFNKLFKLANRKKQIDEERKIEIEKQKKQEEELQSLYYDELEKIFILHDTFKSVKNNSILMIEYFFSPEIELNDRKKITNYLSFYFVKNIETISFLSKACTEFNKTIAVRFIHEKKILKLYIQN